MKRETVFNGKTYIQFHGNPFDRGMADSYYDRPKIPHFYPQGSYHGEIVKEEAMTQEEREAYNAGYDYNQELGFKKYSDN